jgi:hypothetical protein
MDLVQELALVSSSAMYAYFMHPEMQGKLNDECPKYEMRLTESVAENTLKSNK